MNEETINFINNIDFESNAVVYEKIVSLFEENRELKKQLEDLFNENSKLRKKLEKSMTFQDYEHTLNKKIQLENQQKEFIEYLKDRLCLMDIISEAEDESDRHYALIRRTAYKEILSKYKEITGVKDE